MVPMMLTVLGWVLNPAAVTVTDGMVPLLVTDRSAARCCVTRTASKTATRAATPASAQPMRRGVSQESARPSRPSTDRLIQ